MASTLKPRFLRPRSAAAVTSAAIAVIVLGETAAVTNHSADVIHACQKTQNGSVRIVASPSECGNGETATSGTSRARSGRSVPPALPV